MHWKKNEYLKLMKDFVSLKINGKHFVSQFNEIYKANNRS